MRSLVNWLHVLCIKQIRTRFRIDEFLTPLDRYLYASPFYHSYSAIFTFSFQFLAENNSDSDGIWIEVRESIPLNPA